MPENTLDCQKLPCPSPLMMARKLVETRQPARLTVIVDNEPAEINVRRYLESQEYAISIQREGVARRLVAERAPGFAADSADETQTVPPQAANEAAAKKETSADRSGGKDRKILVFIASSTLGSGLDAERDAVLGSKLMAGFLSTLPELGADLWRVVLLNSGVTLAAQDSPVLDKLLALEEAGTRILVCGACLEHYGLLPKRAVGETSNMLDIVTSMQLAHSIIRI